MSTLNANETTCDGAVSCARGVNLRIDQIVASPHLVHPLQVILRTRNAPTNLLGLLFTPRDKF